MQHQQQLPSGAELPRVINVQQFAAAREPEVRCLRTLLYLHVGCC